MSAPRMPRGVLDEQGKRAWRLIVAELEARGDLAESDGLAIELAATSYSIAAAAGAALQRDGLTVPSKRGGPRAHPAFRLQQQALGSYLAALRVLGLAKSSGRGRPPAVRDGAETFLRLIGPAPRRGGGG